MIFPDFAEFSRLAGTGNLVPVYREIMADMDTPVTAFRKIDDGCRSFLLESIEGGEKWGRYSFLGSNPSLVVRSRGDRVEVLENGTLTTSTCEDPTRVVREIIGRYRPVEVAGLPRFCGGAVGCLGYDMVRHFECLPAENADTIGAWDSWFMVTDSLLVFDSVKQKIQVVANAFLDAATTPEDAYRQAVERIEALVAKLRRPLEHRSETAPAEAAVAFASNMTREQFEESVERAKEYVRAGDIIQVVLSQRFSGSLTVDPFDVYRVLRTLNPSPYLFFLRMDDTVVTGASPEVMVRKEGTHVELRPIAGTRPRGATPEEDARLAEELLADPKERAEHVMLVDLGRNDLGRVCRSGSVEVSELMVIERYSHVMHIVSNVRGELEGERDAFDLVRATFPAGTLSGAPKIRAMEIIDELEPVRRGIYGGAVGYVSFSGNMDLAIAIRTLVVKDGQVHLQAGAGIVADSDPAAEWQETVNKAMAVRRAIEIAERGLE
ncbi:anthranilate synthase component I [Trichlorobacter ammonificans]|uniref:Anthranilate synthase component 1 n=1 Tax=Trichlorobacter ammonificans TaxID=2916410 RepID=A0ABM9D9Z9_9BACT|nr:anthranilate synthase component I [Trichlorobacter ammonificans]CAH2031594.1 Anthranilate synthase component 1 [Trichlorobacter ammonificans]